MTRNDRLAEAEGMALARRDDVAPEFVTAPAEAEVRSMSERAHRALLATLHDEMLTPVRAIIQTADRVLDDPKAREQQSFHSDIRRVRLAAAELQELMESSLSGQLLASVDAHADVAALRSKVRHDMLNKLNPVINYTEMWLEDAADAFLEAQTPDLEMLHSLGKRCMAIVDTILGSWEGETDLAAASEQEMRRLEDVVKRMTGDVERRQTETGDILVVDDNEVNRDILRRMLVAQGHRVHMAENGKRALETVKRQKVDVILLDIIMPEMDGFAVLTRLKEDASAQDIPVIIISALNEVDYVASCIKLGAEDYLHRPYSATLLKARVGASLEKKRLREREIEHLEQIERERRRADELLHVILPPEIVTELKTTNAVTPRRYDSVAVLFADIVDFTPYCEKHSPETVLHNLQQLVEKWEDAAHRHQIQKIKTIGDAFMAACGLLTPVENPVVNAILCGMEMIDATTSLDTGWNLRVGIHFGQVVAGVLGSRQYLFDLWGDTVNTAARMESHGIKGNIVLSQEAWQHVQHLSQAHELDALPVKGKGAIPRFLFMGFMSGADRDEI